MSASNSQKAYLKFGVIGSVIWGAVIIIVLFGFVGFAWADFKTMKPSEWGDFLAGVFAPLAFFWFVVAFLQQGAELRASVDQFTHQAKALEETNTLESQKLAMAEWDRTHQEMSSILAQYLYRYFASQKRANMTEVDIAQSMANPDYKPKGVIDPAEFVEGSWNRYSLGDKNAFFRTVFYQTKSAKPEIIENLGPSTQIGGRYLALQRRLQGLIQDQGGVNNLLMTEEMIGIAKFLCK